MRGENGTGPDVVGIDFAQHPGGVDGVAFPHGRASQSGHPVFGKLKSGGHRLFSSFDMPLRRDALVDLFQQIVVSGFKAHVQPIQPGLLDRHKGFGGFHGKGAGAGIRGHAVDGGKCLPQVYEHLHQLTGFHEEAVGIL